MSTYNFDKSTRVGDFEVNLCTAEAYGCFEDVEDGGEGGLWFERKEDGTLKFGCVTIKTGDENNEEEDEE